MPHSRRLAFAKAHANDLWQTDTLHGPYLRTMARPRGPSSSASSTTPRASSPTGSFYPANTTRHLIDCLQTAIHKRGIPKAIYADNGSNHSSGEFAAICSRLGTVLIHTPVRDGAAKGEIERFFRTVREQFLIRDLGTITSLRQLNEAFTRWTEETYHERVHSTLGMKPVDRFGLDLHPVRRVVDSEYNHELFHLQATRKVRAGNTFLFNNVRYEAPATSAGKPSTSATTASTPGPIPSPASTNTGSARPSRSTPSPTTAAPASENPGHSRHHDPHLLRA